jgi:hypothetical protein
MERPGRDGPKFFHRLFSNVADSVPDPDSPPPPLDRPDPNPTMAKSVRQVMTYLKLLNILIIFRHGLFFFTVLMTWLDLAPDPMERISGLGKRSGDRCWVDLP